MIKNLLIVYLFTISSVMAGLPPTTIKNQNASSKTVNFNLELPNNQSVPTAASTALITTGNKDELQNSNFEHTTVTTGWTVSNATASANTTTQFEGKKSLSLALTGALSLSQSSTINAARKLGVQMVASIWVNSSDVSDLQLCSLKNGAEDKCTVTGGYVQGSGWRQLTVSFLGNATSNGLKLKSTDTTGTVLVDQAFVGVGSPIVDFTPDMVYSAEISSTGVVSNENTDWLSGNCTISSTAQFDCPVVSGLATEKINCIPQRVGTSFNDRVPTYDFANSNNTNLRFRTSDTTNGAATAGAFAVTCQKQGADYKTSKAYVASGSVALNTTVYSAKVSAAGVVSDENTDWINGNATPSSNLFPISFVSGVFTVAPNCVVTPDSTSLVTAFVYTTETTSGVTIATTASGSGSAQAFNIICQKQGADYTSSFNPVIVGSFQGYNETPGTSRVETFSFSYGTTNATTVCSASPCSYLDQIGNSVTSVTRSTQGIYSANLSKTYSKLKCTYSGDGAAGYVAQGLGLSCSNCSTMPFNTRTSQTNTINDAYGTLICQGIPQ